MRTTRNKNCYSPRRPDCFIVQDTNLMHPAPTVHAFNKPEQRDRDEDTSYMLKSSKHLSFMLFPDAEIWNLANNLQFRVQCVILLLLKLILVYRSEINSEGVLQDVEKEELVEKNTAIKSRSLDYRQHQLSLLYKFYLSSVFLGLLSAARRKGFVLTVCCSCSSVQN